MKQKYFNFGFNLTSLKEEIRSGIRKRKAANSSFSLNKKRRVFSTIDGSNFSSKYIQPRLASNSKEPSQNRQTSFGKGPKNRPFSSAYSNSIYLGRKPNSKSALTSSQGQRNKTSILLEKWNRHSTHREGSVKTRDKKYKLSDISRNNLKKFSTERNLGKKPGHDLSARKSGLSDSFKKIESLRESIVLQKNAKREIFGAAKGPVGESLGRLDKPSSSAWERKIGSQLKMGNQVNSFFMKRSLKSSMHLERSQMKQPRRNGYLKKTSFFLEDSKQKIEREKNNFKVNLGKLGSRNSILKSILAENTRSVLKERPRRSTIEYTRELQNKSSDSSSSSLKSKRVKQISYNLKRLHTLNSKNNAWKKPLKNRVRFEKTADEKKGTGHVGMVPTPSFTLENNKENRNGENYLEQKNGQNQRNNSYSNISIELNKLKLRRNDIISKKEPINPAHRSENDQFFYFLNQKELDQFAKLFQNCRTEDVDRLDQRYVNGF